MLNELFPKTEQNTENQQQLVENRASFKKMGREYFHNEVINKRQQFVCGQ